MSALIVVEAIVWAGRFSSVSLHASLLCPLGLPGNHPSVRRRPAGLAASPTPPRRRLPTLPTPAGASIPSIGLGVYQMSPGEETYQAVLHALQIGYRHIDTAQM